MSLQPPQWESFSEGKLGHNLALNNLKSIAISPSHCGTERSKINKLFLPEKGILSDLHSRERNPHIVTLLNISTLDDNVINICSCAGSDKGN